MSVASREYFRDWVRENERDPEYRDWLVITTSHLTREVNTVNIENAFPEKYLKHESLQGRKLKLIISHVAMEQVGGNDTKPVLYFDGKEKGLVLNKTKARTLSGAFGSETEGWRGKEVIISPTQVLYEGKMTGSIALEPFVPLSEDADSVPF